jgi:hypothetical protein
MAILCLGNRSLRLDCYGFIGELAVDGSVRPVTGVLPMARCLRAAGVRQLAVAEENAAEACVAHLDGSDPLPSANAGNLEGALGLILTAHVGQVGRFVDGCGAT